ncbi:MAG: histidinol-phosphate transaminase [Bacillota bacterium]
MRDKIDKNCKLDANESPFSLPQKIQSKIEREIKDFEFNRYPDSNATKLKNKLANYTGISSDKLIIGNGSDELLLMIMTAFLAPNKKAVISKPTFGMYEFYADLIGNGSYNLSLKSDFSPNWQEIKKYANKSDTSLIVFCSPNNPTGKEVDEEKLEEFIKNTDKYILLDEAYYEFSGKTLIELVNKYENLIVTRTFSKAFAIASLRIGYLAANKKIVDKLEEVRSIYNSDRFSQKTASLILEDINLFEKQWKLIRKNRDELYKELKDIKGVTPYSSKANFILFNTELEEKSVYEKLKKKGIEIRFLENLRVLGDSLRVTVGSEDENSKFLLNLREILYSKKEVAK